MKLTPAEFRDGLFQGPGAASTILARALGLENELQNFRLIGFDGDLLSQHAVLFMPSLQRIVAGRNVFQIEGAILVGDREVRMLEDRDVALHPRVHITLYGNDFLAGETLLDWR